MSILGLFGGGSKVKRLVKKLTNAYVQTQERQRVMQVLADIGTEEAWFGLMQRFTYRTDGSIVDEDEKQQAYELLVGAGASAIPAIESFVTDADTVYWPLKALREIAGMDLAVDLLLRALDKASEVSMRRNEHKAELVSNLRDFPHPKVQERLLALVGDPDEDVRIMACDGLLTYGADVALEPIAERVLDETESLRVKTVLFEQLLERGWSLSKWAEEIEEREILPGHYRLGPKGNLKRV